MASAHWWIRTENDRWRKTNGLAVLGGLWLIYFWWSLWTERLEGRDANLSKVRTKKKTSSNMSPPDVFRRGEKIVFLDFPLLSAALQPHFNRKSAENTPKRVWGCHSSSITGEITIRWSATIILTVQRQLELPVLFSAHRGLSAICSMHFWWFGRVSYRSPTVVALFCHDPALRKCKYFLRSILARYRLNESELENGQSLCRKQIE